MDIQKKITTFKFIFIYISDVSLICNISITRSIDSWIPAFAEMTTPGENSLQLKAES